jgi:hypothetical protein
MPIFFLEAVQDADGGSREAEEEKSVYKETLCMH